MKIVQSKLLALLVVLWFGIAWSSEFDKPVPFSAGTQFYNVVGSDGDRYSNANGTVCKSWISFWEYYNTGGEGYFSNCNLYGNISESVPCAHCGETGDVVGGHIHTGDGNIYILPICRSHNSEGTNINMTVNRNINAIKLKNYGYWWKWNRENESIEWESIY